ncbi:MAG: exosortase [Candidatus Rokuibacteriota bacterium]|nr:MAG: exosortase [Candidatus Rokubacteria bacterium]
MAIMDSVRDAGQLEFRCREATRAVVFVTVMFAVLLGALYANVLPELVSDWWEDANYSHGFLVPLFSAYLVWQRREVIRATECRPSWWGLGVILIGIASLVLGHVGAEAFLNRSSLIVILAGLILFHAGGPVLRAVMFPLAFLLFMIPLPAIVFYAVAFPLQGLAAQNAAWTLDHLGVPVLIDGNVIHLSHISLGVTEACSGIRSLISLLALALGWAALVMPGGIAMAIFAAVTIPITILANAARVVMTGLVGQWFGRQYAEGFFHMASGWIIFVFAFFCLLAVDRGLRFVLTRRTSRP